MAILSAECPHCSTPKSPMASIAFTPHGDGLCYGFFMCPICTKPVSVFLVKSRAGGASSWSELKGYSKTTSEAGFDVLEMWPEPSDAVAPNDVPPHIARNFIQAEEAAGRMHLEAAGMAYRRVLELTMKDKGPALTGTLYSRIENLAEQGKLTPDIKDWAHSIRELGNEAAHEASEPSPDDISDLAAFTRVSLEYLYTMPAKVARRSNPSATTEEAVG